MVSAEAGPAGGSPILDKLDPFSSRQADRLPPDIGPSETALLVIDMVHDYLDPAGAMPLPDTAPVLAAARRLADAAHGSNVLLVWVRPGHFEHADGLFRKRIVHALEGTPGPRLHPSLPVLPTDRVLHKRRYSAFFATDLDLYLREHRIRRAVLAGVALNICVRATVHDAFFLGYDVWLAADACQATGRREHDSTLYDVQTHFGTVLTVADIEKAWR